MFIVYGESLGIACCCFSTSTSSIFHCLINWREGCGQACQKNTSQLAAWVNLLFLGTCRISSLWSSAFLKSSQLPECMHRCYLMVQYEETGEQMYFGRHADLFCFHNWFISSDGSADAMWRLIMKKWVNVLWEPSREAVSIILNNFITVWFISLSGPAEAMCRCILKEWVNILWRQAGKEAVSSFILLDFITARFVSLGGSAAHTSRSLHKH